MIFFKNLQSLPRFTATKVLEKQSQGNKIKFVTLKKQDDNGHFGVSLAVAPSSLICSCGIEEFKKEIYIATLPVQHPLLRSDKIFAVNGNLIEEDYQKAIDSLFEAQKQDVLDLIVVHDARINYATSCGHLRGIDDEHIEKRFDLPLDWSFGSLRGFGPKVKSPFSYRRVASVPVNNKLIVDLPYGWKKVISAKASYTNDGTNFRLDVILEDPSGNKYSIFNRSRFDNFLAKNPSLKYDKDVTNFEVSWMSFKMI